MSSEAWLWFWIGAAVFLSVSEIFTAGFFMLPFGIGAAAAAVLAYFEAGEVPQLLVFIGISLIALFLLRRFVRIGDENQPNVGSNRFVGQRARVIEAIDRAEGVGRVRMETETWRATTDGAPIEEGTEVKVLDVRGTRLVVEPID
jgi:membrane protein implicated in regulation of membrane protease activity